MSTKVCTLCAKPRHLTQFHPAKRGPKPALCTSCSDSLRDYRKEVTRDLEILTSIQGLYS